LKHICTELFLFSSASRDYNATTIELQFGPQPSQQQECEDVAIINDALLESDETFSIVLTTSAENTAISHSTSTITILDDDSMSACAVHD